MLRVASMATATSRQFLISCSFSLCPRSGPNASRGSPPLMIAPGVGEAQRRRRYIRSRDRSTSLRPVTEDFNGEVARGVPRPQRLLVELADARLGDGLDEGPALREPPSRHPAREEVTEVPGAGGHGRAQHDTRKGPLAPPVVHD